MYLKMISGTFPEREILMGGKNWAIFGLQCTIFEIHMFEGDYVVGTAQLLPPLAHLQQQPTDRPHALSPVHRPSVCRHQPSVAGGLSVGSGSTVHVCGLTQGHLDTTSTWTWSLLAANTTGGRLALAHCTATLQRDSDFTLYDRIVRS